MGSHTSAGSRIGTDAGEPLKAVGKLIIYVKFTKGNQVATKFSGKWVGGGGGGEGGTLVIKVRHAISLNLLPSN